MLEQEQKGYVLASIGQESGEIPYTCYYARKSYIEQNPEIIQNSPMLFIKDNYGVIPIHQEKLRKLSMNFP